MMNAMQTTTAQAEMCRMTAHCIRVATRRVNDTLFMQLRMWMGIFRPRPLQLRTPRRATPIRVWCNQPPRTSEMRRARKMMTKMNSSLYVHRRNCRRDTEQNGKIRDKLARKAWTTRRLAIRRWQMQQNNSSVRCITWTHANWAKSRRLASSS